MIVIDVSINMLAHILEDRMYFIHDDSGIHKTTGMIQVKGTDLTKWNEDQWGVFTTVNTFTENREKACLKSLKYWYLDIDHATEKKEEILQLIREKFPLQPNRITETKNGYHLWYRGSNMTVENYKVIQKGLAQKLLDLGHKTDFLCDVTRVLRAPGFFHWKDPVNPFMVQVVDSNRGAFSEQQMKVAFPYKEKKFVITKQRAEEWDNVACLKAISGMPEVAGDVFDVKGNTIYVNHKETANWIDEEGYIGSFSGGGPTIVQWLKWYGHGSYSIEKLLKAKGVKYGEI